MRRPAPLALLLAAPLLAQDPDRDGDGLSDFHEVHKYFTDPDSADSDGDGTPDSGWFERREYTYTLRTIVHVIEPVTDDVLCDDYQDARVLDRQPGHVELEVVHYPLNTVATAIVPDPDWRENAAAQAEYLAPGPSANWDEELREQLTAALAADGIDVLALDDVELVRQASRWLLAHASSVDLFTTFNSEVGPDGRVRLYPPLAERSRAEAERAGLTVEEALQRELFAKGMFENASRGSCTSSSIYQGGCLRALGIPTRIVLTIPVIDASDERERAFLARITHAGVRRAIEDGTGHLGSSWASHTYNEVFVGGRWRRLNYTRLGQNILDPDYFGLMTHVATVSDWLDGGFAATIGVRQSRRPVDDVFGHYNPYSCISLSDQFGPHCELESPPAVDPGELTTLTIERAYWFSDPSRHPSVAMRLDDPEYAGHALVHVAEGDPGRGPGQYRRFYGRVGKEFLLRADGHPEVRAAAARGYWAQPADGVQEFYLRIEPAELARMQPDVAYALVARNGDDTYRWRVADGVTLTLPAGAKGVPPPADSETARTVLRAFWSDDPDRPEWVRLAGLHLLVEPLEREEWVDFKAFTERVDKHFTLEAEGHEALTLVHGVGGLSGRGRHFAMLMVVSGAQPAEGVAYTLRARNASPPYEWVVPEGTTITR